MVTSLFFGFNLTKFLGLVLVVWLMHFFGRRTKFILFMGFAELKTKIRDTNLRGGGGEEDDREGMCRVCKHRIFWIKWYFVIRVFTLGIF
jgi:hypothetical protein